MKLNRRDFMQSSTAAVVAFSFAGCGAQDSSPDKTLFEGRISVSESGAVELLMGKVELGQGIGTALAQIVAEELGVAFDQVSLINVDTDFSPDESYTFSSISIQQSGAAVREAAIRTREILDEARKLPRNDVNSVIGKSIQRIDIPPKLFGEESYLQDLRLPEMVHARVVRPPTDRATIASFEAAVAEQIPGVIKVVRDGGFVAVVASREGQASAAASKMAATIEWDVPHDLPDSDDIFVWLRKARSRTEAVEKSGEVDVDSANGSTHHAVYQRPYQAHASISPSMAVALFDGGKLTVWSHAQGMYPLRAALAHVFGLTVDQVRCVHMEASGCYGHNGADDAACDAAAVAMNMPGTAVRLQWERADEFRWEPFGPAMHIEVVAAIGDDGIISDWQYDLWSCPHTGRPRSAESAGNLIYAQHKADPLPLPAPRSIPQPNGGADRNAVPLYTIGNIEINKHLVTEVPVRGSSLRGLGAYGNVFAIESFLDELAVASASDPFEFRLRHLSDTRAIEVLQTLRDRVGWETRPGSGDGTGWGLGFAQFKNLSSYLAVVVQLSVDANAQSIRLLRVNAVCDAGLIVNPDGIKAQIEGGILQSASWTLKEQVRFSSSGIETRDWSDYPILRFDEIPEVHVELIDKPDEKSLGVGETAQGPTAAAIANAVYHATGIRARRLPIIPSLFR